MKNCLKLALQIITADGISLLFSNNSNKPLLFNAPPTALTRPYIPYTRTLHGIHGDD